MYQDQSADLSVHWWIRPFYKQNLIRTFLSGRLQERHTEPDYLRSFFDTVKAGTTPLSNVASWQVSAPLQWRTISPAFNISANYSLSPEFNANDRIQRRRGARNAGLLCHYCQFHHSTDGLIKLWSLGMIITVLQNKVMVVLQCTTQYGTYFCG